MASLAASYAAGNFVSVWQTLQRMQMPVADGSAAAYRIEDIDDVIRQTFNRVELNVETLIVRLRDTGYRFECEAGRHGPPVPPRRPGLADALEAQAHLRSRFAEDEGNWSADPFPRALMGFAKQIGSLDLRQRFPPAPPVPDTPALTGGAKVLSDLLQNALPGPDPAEDARQAEISRRDREPHPQANDPVLARLGDWDPLVVDLSMVAQDVGDEEADFAPLPEGGMAILAEIAPSFEHKANVSGATNPYLRLPNPRIDPMVFGDGGAMPFTSYLRQAFASGGFLGVPHPVRTDTANTPLRTVSPGLSLPDHPIFGELARQMDPF